MIWEYRAQIMGGGTRTYYGTPVLVHVEGVGYKQFIYQYGSPTQPRAVVHLQSGRIVARIEDSDRGHITEISQAAISRIVTRIGVEKFLKAFQYTAVINDEARVVWTRP